MRMKSATPQQQVSYWRRVKPRKLAKGLPRLTRKLKLWNNACAWVRETMRQEGYKKSLTLKAEGEVHKRAKEAYDFAWAKIMAARCAEAA